MIVELVKADLCVDVMVTGESALILVAGTADWVISSYFHLHLHNNISIYPFTLCSL